MSVRKAVGTLAPMSPSACPCPNGCCGVVPAYKAYLSALLCLLIQTGLHCYCSWLDWGSGCFTHTPWKAPSIKKVVEILPPNPTPIQYIIWAGWEICTKNLNCGEFQTGLTGTDFDSSPSSRLQRSIFKIRGSYIQKLSGLQQFLAILFTPVLV